MHHQTKNIFEDAFPEVFLSYPERLINGKAEYTKVPKLHWRTQRTEHTAPPKHLRKFQACSAFRLWCFTWRRPSRLLRWWPLPCLAVRWARRGITPPTAAQHSGLGNGLGSFCPSVVSPLCSAGTRSCSSQPHGPELKSCPTGVWTEPQRLGESPDSPVLVAFQKLLKAKSEVLPPLLYYCHSSNRQISGEKIRGSHLHLEIDSKMLSIH